MSSNSDERVTMQSVQAVGGALIIVLCATTAFLTLASVVFLGGALGVLVGVLLLLHGVATLMMFGVLRVEANIERQKHMDEQHTIRGFPIVDARGYK